jgi:hypothetical protein
MLSRASTALLATIVGAVAWPAAGAGAGVPIKGYVDDLSVASDGSIRLATSRGLYRQAEGVDQYAVAPDGTATAAPALVPASRRIGWSDAAFTSDGAVAAYRVQGKKRSVIRAVIWTPAGLAGPGQTLSDPRHGAGGLSVTAGPNGAAAVVFKQGRGKKSWQDMIAVRAAGAARFSKAVPLGRVRSGEQFVADVPDRIQVVFAADGTGAIAQVSEARPAPIRLRRISTSGAVSAAIVVDRGPYEFASSDLAIAPNGTVVAAFMGLRDDQSIAPTVFASTLPPGATIASPVQQLGESDTDVEDGGGLSLMLDGDRAIVATGVTGGANVDLFEGAPTSLAPTAGLASNSRGNVLLTPSGDGGVSIFWVGATDRAATRYAVFGAHRPPAGAWSVATPITTPTATDFDDGPLIGAVAAVPGAGVVVALQRPTPSGSGRLVELVRAP